ncbi:MAG: S-adenosyl-L-methionine dependent methyltransferase, similar to cyclopropane-fatty-acyl-phospholipid synthase [uncultured Nocardioides sp.]|uniref:S-adenosyl-L-methionine dependent methyltransferase, similar to cyclopropane-fatty-acyl-phospholipid synthase n=1 Tax=uncultured Nocardioides sp. TaxID=198441 RepID=A0A6J4NDD3_9ACTN|nr:MAG: S-adenosyl-L-methionine dependent methyltransferase, similar to cyclopropane-fatty-acyl-phospholipid synthase [uncultured Nocardioides sp.]
MTATADPAPSTSVPAPVPAATVAERLPGLEPLPSGPRTAVGAGVARRLFVAAMSRLDVTVEDATTGETFGRGGPRMVVHRPDELFGRVGRDGLIGFGEAFLTGAWDADDLAAFLTVPAARMAELVPPSLQRARSLVTRRMPQHHRSTKDNSRANIAHHYDLSNALFELFLDETMSYSAALFDTPVTTGHESRHLVAAAPATMSALATDDAGRPVHSPDLAEAQVRKIERLLDRAEVGEGTRVLEIGTGWGELAIRAASRGATVHSITLSREQQDLAIRRIDEAGFSERATVELCDYRDLLDDDRPRAAYDAVLSVEMIEAVGHEFWRDYFQVIDAVLAPGGKVAIQAITMPHDRMLATRGGHTWINKYVFPGGFLPSTEALDEVTRDATTLRVVERLSMADHYAETLRRWEELFLAREAEVAALGGDETFRRIWHFYLAYSRAGFASGYLDVQQLLLTREDPS